MRKRFARLVQQQQMCYPLAVIMLDRIVHDDLHPICGDSSCPCHAERSAPYLDCPCSSCKHVRQVLAEWHAWNSQAMQQAPTETPSL